MHGRQTVTAKMIRNTPVPIHIVYTTDEDGEFLDQFPSVVKTQTHNNPVSDKLITNLFRSKDLRWSKMTIMGSDDVMCPKAWQLVEDMLDVYEAVAFRNSYFLDTETGETYFWNGYIGERSEEPLGQGRSYTIKAVEKLNWDLWDRGKDSGMDGSNWKRFKDLDIGYIDCIRDDVQMIQLKSNQQITPLHRIVRKRNEVKRCNLDYSWLL